MAAQVNVPTDELRFHPPQKLTQTHIQKSRAKSLSRTKHDRDQLPISSRMYEFKTRIEQMSIELGKPDPIGRFQALFTTHYDVLVTAAEEPHLGNWSNAIHGFLRQPDATVLSHLVYQPTKKQKVILIPLLSACHALSSYFIKLVYYIEKLEPHISNIRAAFNSLKTIPRAYIRWIITNPFSATSMEERALVSTTDMRRWIHEFDNQIGWVPEESDWQKHITQEEESFQSMLRMAAKFLEEALKGANAGLRQVTMLLDEVKDGLVDEGLSDAYTRRWINRQALVITGIQVRADTWEVGYDENWEDIYGMVRRLL